MSFRLTAIALAVLAVLGIAVWFTEFRDRGSAQATPAEKTRPEIFKFDDKETQAIEILKGDQRMRVERDDSGNWVLQPSGQAADRIRVTSVLYRLSTLQSTRLVAEDTPDLGQYGLATPAVVASVTQSDGTTYVLETGARAPADTATYARRGGENTVYLIANALMTDLEKMVNEPPVQPPTPAPVSSPTPAG